MGRCPPAVTMDAAALVASLHARLLRGIADEYGIHFQGLRAAAGHLRRAGIVTPRMAKRLTNVDIAFNIGRHITSISADAFFSEVLGEKRERALINQSATLPCTMDLLRTGVASSGSSTVFALDSDEERLARAPIRFDMFDVDEFRTAATQTDGLIWSGYLDGGGCRVDGGALCGGFHGDSGGVLSDGGCFHEDGGVLSDGLVVGDGEVLQDAMACLPSLVVNEWPALPAWPLSCALVVAPTAPASSTESTAVVSSASVGIAGLTLEEHTAPRASKAAELERAELAVLELALLASDDEETSSDMRGAQNGTENLVALQAAASLAKFEMAFRHAAETEEFERLDMAAEDADVTLESDAADLASDQYGETVICMDDDFAANGSPVWQPMVRRFGSQWMT